jgi:translation initiation factor IF-2
VTGSVEAIRQALEAIEISDDFAICKVDVVIAGVGDVTSSDIAIAAVSKAKVIAFGVTAGFNSIEEARSLNVDIGYYNVVYELLDELENKLKVTLAPPPPGKLVGRGEIKKIFKLGKAGKIAGCLVLEGVIKTESKVRIMRGKRNPVYTGSLSTLKVVKDDVKEVPVGSDCGMSFRDFSDFEEGDIIECFITGNDVI